MHGSRPLSCGRGAVSWLAAVPKKVPAKKIMMIFLLTGHTPLNVELTVFCTLVFSQRSLRSQARGCGISSGRPRAQVAALKACYDDDSGANFELLLEDLQAGLESYWKI